MKTGSPRRIDQATCQHVANVALNKIKWQQPQNQTSQIRKPTLQDMTVAQILLKSPRPRPPRKADEDDANRPSSM